MADFNHTKLIAFLLCVGALMVASSTSMAQSSPYISPPSWSKDGSRIAIVLNHDVVVIWDAISNQVLYTLTGHTDFIQMVAWSADSSMIATPSFDQTVKVWDANNGVLLHTLVGHNAAVTAVAWSPDSSSLLSWGFDTRPNLLVWDVVSGSLLERYNSGTIVAAAFSPDGTQLALSNSLGIGTIDAQTLEVISGSPSVSCCTNQMRSIAWSDDNSKFVTGSLNGLVTIWDANTSQILSQFVANLYYASDSREVDDLSLSWVRDVAFSPDSETVLSVSGDGTIREWNAATGALMMETQLAPLSTAAWSPYASRLVTVSAEVQDSLASNPEQEVHRALLTNAVEIVVPFPSVERLQTIASACNMPADIAQSIDNDVSVDLLAELREQIKALPENTISPACAADFIAVAEALQG